VKLCTDTSLRLIVQILSMIFELDEFLVIGADITLENCAVGKNGPD